ncbi:hypothetical protein CVT24_012385 [Panaeolus cyanescens]|uniref:Uncharacterized protein n=1 Tax=Panaeolus cyanescens TaxID=181874 RepID=A0A409YJE4_9AGAR|nr:hypothetical protein CVT24_012385 [Panaeolus cyanescens]
MAAVLTGIAASGPLILKAIELIEAFSAAYETLKRVDAIASTNIAPLAIQCDEHFRALLGISHLSAQNLYTAVRKFITDVVPVIESEEHDLSRKLDEARQAADEICSLAKKDNLSIQKGFDNVKNAIQTICEELCHTQSSMMEDAERPLKDICDRIAQLTKAIGPRSVKVFLCWLNATPSDAPLLDGLSRISPIPLSLVQRFLVSVQAFIPILRTHEGQHEHEHNHGPSTEPQSPLMDAGDTDTQRKDADLQSTYEGPISTGPLPEPIVHEPNYRDFIYGDLMSLSKYLDDPQNPSSDEELQARVKMEKEKYETTMVTLKNYETHVSVPPKN